MANPTSKFQFDVFLSHSSKVRAVVPPLEERLRQDGLKVWSDEWVLKPGDSIPAKIEAGLEHSRVRVLCMSAHAFGSDWAQLEAGTFRFRDPLKKGVRTFQHSEKRCVEVTPLGSISGERAALCPRGTFRSYNSDRAATSGDLDSIAPVALCRSAPALQMARIVGHWTEPPADCNRVQEKPCVMHYAPFISMHVTDNVDLCL